MDNVQELLLSYYLLYVFVVFLHMYVCTWYTVGRVLFYLLCVQIYSITTSHLLLAEAMSHTSLKAQLYL